MKEIFKGIVGSQAFGLATETSDIDYRSVYIQSNQDILSNLYIPQTNYNKDDVGYEIRRFLELAVTGNPNIIELLYLPENCILKSTDEWKYLVSIRDQFLSKHCYNTFVNYAKSQLNKSRGQNKKFNWEKERIERKDVLDFCIFLDKSSGNTFKIKDWLKDNNLDQSQVGLAKIDGFRDSYKLYTDMLKWTKDNPPNHRFDMEIIDRNYRGIAGEDCNEPRLSEIEKYMIDLWYGILYFNREQYSIHCREYKEYQNWLQNRNEHRVATNKQHGQQFDSKNVLHLVRLINEAEEIATKKTVIVDRSFERNHLLSIKEGKVDLKSLIDEYDQKSKNLEKLFMNSDLPEQCDININNLEYSLRNYGRKIN